MKNMRLLILLFVTGFSFSSLADVKPNPELDCCLELNMQLQEQNTILTNLLKTNISAKDSSSTVDCPPVNIVNNNCCENEGNGGRDWFDYFLDYLLKVLAIVAPVIIAWIAARQTLKKIKINAKLTFEHSKATRISTARIEWMQKLRPKVSSFMSEVAALNYYLREVMELKESKQNNEARDLYKSQIERLVNIRAVATEIKLFLNRKEELHDNLGKAMDNFLDVAIDEYDKITDNDEFYEKATEIEKLAAAVLKDVWEQAKSDGDDIDEKNFE